MSGKAEELEDKFVNDLREELNKSLTNLKEKLGKDFKNQKLDFLSEKEKLIKNFETQKLEYLEGKRKLENLFNENYKGAFCKYNVYLNTNGGKHSNMEPSKPFKSAIDWWFEDYLVKKGYKGRIVKGDANPKYNGYFYYVDIEIF